MPSSTDQLARLQELAALQQQTHTAMLALLDAGSRPSDETYDRYLALARRWSLASRRFRGSSSPGGFDVSGFAQPLVKWLTMYADHHQAAGDSQGRPTASRRGGRGHVDVPRRHCRRGLGRDQAMRRRPRVGSTKPCPRWRRAASLSTTQGRCSTRCRPTSRSPTSTSGSGTMSGRSPWWRAPTIGWRRCWKNGPPSTAQVNAGVARQIAGIMGGHDTGEGEGLAALQRIAFEVVQSEARTSRLTGRYDDAERLFLQARPFAVEFGVPASIDFHLAVIAVARGDAAAARDLLASIAPAFESEQFRPRRAALRQVQADLHLLVGDPGNALSLAEDGLRDQATYPDLDLAWKLQWRRAKALAALGEGAQAVDAFRAGLSEADRLRMAPLGYRLDTTFVETSCRWPRTRSTRHSQRTTPGR